MFYLKRELIARNRLAHFRFRGRCDPAIHLTQRAQWNESILGDDGFFLQHDFAIHGSHARVVSLVILLWPAMSRDRSLRMIHRQSRLRIPRPLLLLARVLRDA